MPIFDSILGEKMQVGLERQINVLNINNSNGMDMKASRFVVDCKSQPRYFIAPPIQGWVPVPHTK